MRKTTGILASLAAALALCTGIGSASAQGSTDYAVIGRTITKDPAAAALVPAGLNGTIRAATAATSNPMAYLNEKNEIVGFEIDVAKSIAAKLGVKITFDNMKFEGVIPSLQANKADMTAAGMNDTAKRQEVLNFIDYMTLGLVIIVRENDKAIHDITDLCGRTISRVNGDVFGPWLDEKLQPKCEKLGRPKADIRTFPDVSSALLSVKSLSSDSQITGLMNATSVTNSPANKGQLRIVKPADSPRGWRLANGGFGVLKGNIELTKAVEAALKSLEADGFLQALANHYGHPHVIIDKVVVNKPVPDGNIGDIN